MENNSSISTKDAILTETLVLETILYHFPVDIIHLISDYAAFPSQEDVNAFLEKVGRNWLHQSNVDTKGFTLQDAKILARNIPGNLKTREVLFAPGRMGFTFNCNKIKGIVSESQAEKFGIRVGWIIQKVNSQAQEDNQVTIRNAVDKNYLSGKPTLICFRISHKNPRFQIILKGQTIEIGKMESLSKLSLSQKGLDDIDAIILSPLVKNNLSLTMFYLYRNNIGDEGAIAIGEALTNNKTMKLLNVSSNNIRDKGAEAFANALKHNAALQELSLQKNKIGDEGAKAIGDALRSNSTLQMLNLNIEIGIGKFITTKYMFYSGHGVNNNDLIIMAALLDHNFMLQTLNLNGNKIVDKGAKAIGTALNINSSLTVLYLNRNQIGDAGVKAVAHGLKNNSSLTKLAISRNRIRDEGASAVADTMKSNTTIQVIALFTGNDISSPIKRLLSEYKNDKKQSTCY